MVTAANAGEHVVLDLFTAIGAKAHDRAATLSHEEITWTLMLVGMEVRARMQAKDWGAL